MSTPATAVPTTLPAALPPTTAQLLASVACFALIALAGLAITWRLGWWRGPQWAPPRCPNVAASGPLWLGIGAMAITFASVPTTLANVGLLNRQPGADDAGQMVAIALVYVACLGVAVAIHLAMGSRRAALLRLGLADDFPRARRDGWVVLIGLPILVALTSVASGLTQIAWSLLDYHHESAHQLLQLMQRVEGRPIVLLVALANAIALAPLFEEIFFRGHLQTALTAILPGRWPAIIVTSLLFAAMHEAWTIPPIFALSLIVGYVYERTGSLCVAIGLHLGFNAISTAIFLASRG